MTTQPFEDTDDLDEDVEDDQGATNPNLVKHLRQQIKEAKAESKQLRSQIDSTATDRKELAFLKADIPDSKMAAFFRDHYDGELTADAIRSSAMEYGLVPTTTPDAQVSVDAFEDASDAAQGDVQPMRDDEEFRREFGEALRKDGTQAGEHANAVMRKYGRPVASDDR